MTLGQIIVELEDLPQSAHVRFDDGTPVGRFASYRGFYDQLALGTANYPPRVWHLLAQAKLALEDTFEGYKGGEYTYDENTPVWADDVGDYSSVGIFDIRESAQGEVVIHTGSIREYV